MAKKATDIAPVLTPYRVMDSLRHDGDDYVIGDTVELDAVTADILIAVGVVEAQ